MVPRATYLPLFCAAFYLLHSGVSKVALKDHLGILRIAAGDDIKSLRSVYRLLSKYKHLETEVTKIYVCSKKKCPAVLKTNAKGVPLPKQPCGHKYVKNTFWDCYILQLPIDKQIVYFIERYLGPWNRRPNPDEDGFRGDVHTLSCYNKLVDDGKINNKTITMQLNTDGAQPCKSSKFGIWPTMLVINEARYKLSRAFIIIMSIWYGNKKPPTEALLNWIVDECNRLQSDGILVRRIQYKIQIILITTDTMGRPILRNSGYHNGPCGCDLCLHPGKINFFFFLDVCLKSGLRNTAPHIQVNSI